MYEVLIEQKFSSAHFLRNYHGKDEPLHGHNWKVQVKFRGQQLAQSEEYLVDFVEVQKILEKVIEKIDYKNLNETPPFDKINPSAENIARWIYAEFVRKLPAPRPARVTVWETESGAASYLPDDGAGEKK